MAFWICGFTWGLGEFYVVVDFGVSFRIGLWDLGLLVVFGVLVLWVGLKVGDLGGFVVGWCFGCRISYLGFFVSRWGWCNIGLGWLGLLDVWLVLVGFGGWFWVLELGCFVGGFGVLVFGAFGWFVGWDLGFTL